MSAFTLNQADLAFVLHQIKVSEAHAAGIPLTSILLDANGRVIADPAALNGNGQTYYVLDAGLNMLVPRDPSQPLAIPDPHVPVGLRTVDGSYNNLIPGRELWGASGQPMPRLFEPNYINLEPNPDGDLTLGDQMPFGGPGAPVVTNNDYGVINGGPTNPNLPGGNGGNTGNVADADPRTISNLIVDMSMNNPAAILAALTFAGSEDPMADLKEILALKISATEAAADLAAATAALDDANATLDAAVLAYVPGNTDAIDDIQEAAEAVTTAEASLAQAQAVAADPHAAMVALAEAKGLTFNNGSLDIPNIAPDEGLSAPFNAWMTFFGQFFDHGLDLISKGGNGTIYIPLAADDPLVLGNDGVAGTDDDLAPELRFMTLTRSTTVSGEGGEPTQRNVTTAFVDQNQTYTSHASHQVFLREYALVDGRPVATGKLLGGEHGGLATWADVKEQARTMLGIELTDLDVGAVPMLLTDAYGEFIRDPATGMPQIMAGVSSTGTPIYVSGTPDAPINPSQIQLPVGTQLIDGNTIAAGETVSAARTFNAFLDDIAHNAAPVVVGGQLVADADELEFDESGEPTNSAEVTGNAVSFNPLTGRNLEYDNELLDRHFITGDGRGNENIGLSAVHHVFHSEHNRQVDAQKLTILQNGDLAFVREWLSNGNDLSEPELASIKSGLAGAANKLTYLASLEDDPNLPTGVAGVQLSWDGERLFQAARFATEMQYQHLVFEEFGRKIQPNIDVFVFNAITDVDPRIFSEFANVIYRFGHSMLTENMPRIDASGNVMDGGDLTLIDSFLNPVLFDNDGGISHDEGAAAIIRGMTIERGNEIDEFITGALRNNLLGLPLDLAAINIARGRDTGMPTLNQARQQLFDASGSTFLTPYDSWVDFAANLKNPMSVVNFIAAYGMHTTITSATTLEAKRAAAMELVLGVEANGSESDILDRVEFLNSTGAWNAGNSGLNDIDLWIGGLAEKKMPFGGFLGSTFNAVFELQMENLQDGDRFYYLTRTQGQNFLNSLEQNSFAKLLMANTNLADPGPDGIRGTADDIVERHIGVDSFATYDYVLEVNPANQADYDPENDSLSGVDPVGNDPVLEALGLGKVVRTDPSGAVAENYIRVFGGEHVVVGGTDGDDTIITDFGDDGIWGDAGDDRIESGAGVDLVNGGAGNDIITDSGDTGDFLKGDEGDDVIANSNGLDILMGGSGKDVFFVGVDATEVFAGEGDDFILGGDDMDFLLGNEGDDWMEAGGGFDTTAGDNSELFFNSAIKGHDVMFAGSDEHDFDAESGDDIMVQGESVMRNEGMFGFDWAIFKGMSLNGYADMNIPIFTTEQADILRNRFDKVEALSGWDHDDTLIGDGRVLGTDGTTVGTAEGVFFNDGLDQAGIDRIAGLNQIVQVGSTGFFESGNILLGGAGSDLLKGNAGDDILDGDRWLNVRIRITGAGQENTAANQIATVDSLKHVFTAAENPAWAGKSLFELLIARTIVPNQLHIVREVITDGVQSNDVDVAVFNDTLMDDDGSANYSFAVNADGSITVRHLDVTVGVIDPVTGQNLVSDGTDTIRNIEQLRFNGTTLNVISGTPNNDNGTAGVGTNGLLNVAALNGSGAAELIVGYGGNDVLNGFGGNDILLGGEGTDALNGEEGNDILNGGPALQTVGLVDTFASSAYNLNGGNRNFSGINANWTETNDTGGAGVGDVLVNAGRLQFGSSTDGNESVQRSFSISDASSATLSFTYEADDLTAGLGVTVEAFRSGSWISLGTLGGDTIGTFTAALTPADTAIRFSAVGAYAAGQNFFIDNVRIAAIIPTQNSGSDQLNGGNGNDTYVIDLTNGNATIQETSGTDRIDVATGTLTGLNAFEGTGDDLLLQVNAATITVTDHFQNDNEAVEFINLDGSTFNGYAFAGDYAVSTDDDGVRTAAIGVNTLLAGTTGGDTLAGDTGADLLFGHSGNDALTGGAGDDLLVGGAGTDTLDGGTGADTLVGGADNDTYVVDDAGDVVVEAASAGTDTVQTALAAYTLGDNVENLTYTGAATFTGTGNALGNLIQGGAGVDTLIGLSGNDTYVVTAGDSIVEVAAGGTDTVQSSASYTLGAELENLTLTGNAAINGAGNSVGNVITGNGAQNQLFGAGGADILNGGDGADLIDGGTDDDTLHGGAGNDTDVLVGGAGNDTIHLNTNSGIANDGNDIVRYTASGFGSDVINGFDANPAGGQDQIDLSGLGITAANFAARVSAVVTAGNTVLTVLNADSTVAGTIQINGVAVGAAANQIQMTPPSSDFILANPGATLNGDGTSQTLNGGAGNDTINGLGGADILNGNGGNDTLSGGVGIASGTFSDNFDGVASYIDNNGTLSFSGGWTEGGEVTSPTGGDIQINAATGSRLHFEPGIDGGEFIQRAFDLSRATSALVQFGYVGDASLTAGDSVSVQAWNHSTNTWQTLTGGTLSTTSGTFTVALSTDQIGANSAIRFLANGAWDADDNFFIDNFIVNASGNLGVDAVNGGDGDDTIIWNANASGLTDGRDLVNGGTETATGPGDTFVILGNADSEAYNIYTRAAWLGIAGNTAVQISAASEIIVTRNGSNSASIIAELAEIEEIRINGFDPNGASGSAGADTYQIIGDFSQTSLRPNTITVEGGTGDDTVDVSALTSAHRIVFRSHGGNDTIIGNLRPQDVIELAPGQDVSTYTLVDNGNGTHTFGNGTHHITFTGAVPPQFQNTPPPAGNDEGVSGAFEYTPSDLAGLKALVNGQQPVNGDDDGGPTGVRELSGHNNNQANPNWGAADQAFIRITNAHYGEPDANGNLAINPVFNGLDPRTISNILGAQEAGLPDAGNDANIFFMAMGQYIDHGLDFLGKGGNGSIQIGAAGGGAPGSGNPADLTRGSVAGYDENGVPQHINRTSPYVDQNQAYGSNDLVGQFLREGDGAGGVGAHLFAGGPDPSNPQFNLLPTLRELIEEHWNNNTVFHSASLPGGSAAFRDYFPGLVQGGVINTTMLPGMISNFMGTSHALLLDTNPFVNVLDHYVAGDGRANENFALTSIHTIWARNHNHHVEGLEAAGFQGTAEELFQAAKMINEAEYQRVVFDEYLETLLGGLRSQGTHGFEEYDPSANAGISHEFAAAVFRFGHSLIGQTMTVLDADGNPTQVNLFDAFLNPSNDPSAFPSPLPPGYTPQPGYAQYGVNAIIGGTVSQPAEDVDFNIVDAVRNDLVRINADLFAFNVARGWDVGLGTLNQVRQDLAGSTNPYVSEAVGFAGGDLSPYTSWEDFQQRNGLSNAVIDQFKQAYPDLVLAAADIAAFQAINPDIDIAMNNDGTGTVKGIDRVDLWVGGLAEQHINGGLVGQTFWVVLSEQFERLQDGDRFYYISRFDNFDFYENFIDGQEFADIVARNTGMTGLPEHMFRTDPIDDDENQNPDNNEGDGDGTPVGNGDDETDDDEDDDEEDDDDTASGGDDEEDEDDDDDEDDTASGDDDDEETAGSDDDETAGGDDDETVTPTPGVVRTGTPQPDVLVGSAGDDNIVAFADADVIIADAGADAISAGEGADFVNAGAGRDVVFAGAGDDQVFAGDGADLVYGDAGNDRIFGDQGNDMINAGAGDDTVFGGAGNDLLVAEIGDGNDVYFGDDSEGGTGIDTLDISAATVAVTVNLGAGALLNGSVTSSQTGSDTIWGIENVNTGSGNDVITASNAVNVINGGAGNDTFRFLTASAADGDTILGFEPGDRLDLSGMDANLVSGGDQSFVLINGAFTAAGQLAVSFERREDGDFTIVQGNIDGNADADFKIEIAGHQNLTASNVGL